MISSSATNALQRTRALGSQRQVRGEIAKRSGAPKINVYSIRWWHIGRAEEYNRSLSQELVNTL